eukprot:Platyproteum_vivax@DN10210_c0_g1_i1.p1
MSLLSYVPDVATLLLYMAVRTYYPGAYYSLTRSMTLSEGLSREGYAVVVVALAAAIVRKTRRRAGWEGIVKQVLAYSKVGVGVLFAAYLDWVLTFWYAVWCLALWLLVANESPTPRGLVELDTHEKFHEFVDGQSNPRLVEFYKPKWSQQCNELHYALSECHTKLGVPIGRVNLDVLVSISRQWKVSPSAFGLYFAVALVENGKPTRWLLPNTEDLPAHLTEQYVSDYFELQSQMAVAGS